MNANGTGALSPDELARLLADDRDAITIAALEAEDEAASGGAELVRASAQTFTAPRAVSAESAERQRAARLTAHTALTARAAEWPAALSDAAYHGLAGDITRMIEPHTEADPVAVLLQFLTGFGSIANRRAFYRVDGSNHFPNLAAVLVGQSSKSRKGTSWARARGILVDVDATWPRDRTGLSSGEGLIYHVRDGDEAKGDAGVGDKRMLIVEPEFASVLRVMSREGNTLSAIIRQAWDGGRLSPMTKTAPVVATDPHISIVGHITRQELATELSRTDAANGFANRFLYALVRRSKELPDGGGETELGVATARALVAAAEHAQEGGRYDRDAKARELWYEVYSDLSRDRPGLYGAVTTRAEAQVVRLALIYALLDRAALIGESHLRAALEVWRYCDESARFIFGDRLGHPLADEILSVLRAAGDAGMTRDEIRNRFSRHKSSEALGQALTLLLEFRLAMMTRERTSGRPAERFRAVGRVRT